MKKEELIPVDMPRCQAERRKSNPFSLGVTPFERCPNKPVWVATERKKVNGVCGSMSLCEECATKMKEKMGVQFATFKAIGAKGAYDYAYYIGVAKAATDRSSGLWLPVNRHIWKVLVRCQEMKKPLKFAAEVLDVLVGDENKNEPSSLSNVRATIEAIRKGEALSLL